MWPIWKPKVEWKRVLLGLWLCSQIRRQTLSSDFVDTTLVT